MQGFDHRGRHQVIAGADKENQRQAVDRPDTAKPCNIVISDTAEAVATDTFNIGVAARSSMHDRMHERVHAMKQGSRWRTMDAGLAIDLREMSQNHLNGGD